MHRSITDEQDNTRKNNHRCVHCSRARGGIGDRHQKRCVATSRRALRICPLVRRGVHEVDWNGNTAMGQTDYRRDCDGRVTKRRIVFAGWTSDRLYRRRSRRAAESDRRFVAGRPNTTTAGQLPDAQGSPNFSPDGRWLAYCSNESGKPQVYVHAFPGPGAKVQVSNDGGTDPVWKRTGGELFYRSGDSMMSVLVSTDATLNAGRPQEL